MIPGSLVAIGLTATMIASLGVGVLLGVVFVTGERDW